jgi:eukaryotic-like serine/threonine-protein kinase
MIQEQDFGTAPAGIDLFIPVKLGSIHMTDALAQGTRLGPYEIQALIGSGGMGRVYRAYDPRLARHVAIKVINAALASDPEAMRRFESEARAIGALNHPNLMVVLDVGRHAGISYMVSELLEGQTLHEWLGQGPLSARQVIDLAAQVARGLAAAHERGVVHRDLKPANLFVTRDRRVKILDFGVAKLITPAAHGDATMTMAPGTAGVILGTASYMSPEQIRGAPLDARTDIFALGVVMHEALAGVRLFHRDTMPDTLSAVLTQEPAPLPEKVSPGLARIVRCCLEKSPEDRFHSAHDLALALDMLSSAASGTVSVPAGISRRRTLVLGASALGAVAGMAGGMLLGREGKGVPAPSFQRLTFRRGLIRGARLAPDGHTVLLGALWDDDLCRIYSTRVDNPESRPLELPVANLLAVSRSGDLALALGANREGVFTYGTLARVPIAGGAPREMVEDVKFADWSPDGDALAIIRRIASSDQLEYPVGKVLLRTSAQTGTGLGFARVAPDGQRVAYVHYKSPQSLVGKVCVIDGSGKVSALTDEYVNIHGLAWRGEQICYTASDSVMLLRALFAVTPGSAPRLIERMPANISLWDAAPDGRLLITQVDDRATMIGRLPGNDSDRDLSWLDVSWITDISRDGKQLLFGESGQGVGAKPAAYLRSVDGSAAVRLAEGWPLALSPDGRSSLVVTGPWATYGSGTALEIVPTGAGETTRVPAEGMDFSGAWWPPAGDHIVFMARQGERGQMLYRLDLPYGKPVPISAEGVSMGALSPDGSHMASRMASGVQIFAVAGGDASEVPGTSAADWLLGWIEDGLLISRPSDAEVPRGSVQVVDPRSGARRPWHNILPSDAAGIMVLAAFRATPDGRTRVYTWHRALCSLYLAAGLT